MHGFVYKYLCISPTSKNGNYQGLKLVFSLIKVKAFDFDQNVLA